MNSTMKQFYDKWLGQGCPPWTWPLAITISVLTLLNLRYVDYFYFFITGIAFGCLAANLWFLHNEKHDEITNSK